MSEGQRDGNPDENDGSIGLPLAAIAEALGHGGVVQPDTIGTPPEPDPSTYPESESSSPAAPVDGSAGDGRTNKKLVDLENRVRDLGNQVLALERDLQLALRQLASLEGWRDRHTDDIIEIARAIGLKALVKELESVLPPKSAKME